ncbi:hypothetical protein E1281_05720 [Actinomadura sp. KC345]|uniref:hypothetical protein n=1 Tax=Actinomadura sp. KC345 TaxID=2530371 RepID=UPI00104444ED|nr:hypothetical protein [Actinomadura sp. KC345]TDC57269.1 hypothetical protein E1281_05720 [Actinomadura sp. KC345]
MSIAVLMAIALIPLHLLAVRDLGVPTSVANLAVIVTSILVANVFLVRDMVLSGDGRLKVTGLGQRIDIDMRHLTEIRASMVAHAGFGLAQVRWGNEGFRIWQSMTYIPDSRRKRRRSRSSGIVSDDFRDLVYRLYLINPAITVHGIAPPQSIRRTRFPAP